MTSVSRRNSRSCRSVIRIPGAGAIHAKQDGTLLCEILVRNGSVSQEKVDGAIAVQEERGGQIGRILVQLGGCTEDAIARALIDQLKSRKDGGYLLSDIAARGAREERGRRPQGPHAADAHRHRPARHGHLLADARGAPRDDGPLAPYLRRAPRDRLDGMARRRSRHRALHAHVPRPRALFADGEEHAGRDPRPHVLGVTRPSRRVGPVDARRSADREVGHLRPRGLVGIDPRARPDHPRDGADHFSVMPWWGIQFCVLGAAKTGWLVVRTLRAQLLARASSP